MHGHGQPPCRGCRQPARGQPATAKAPVQGGGSPQGQQPSWGARAAARDQPCRQQGWRRRPQGWPPLGRETTDRNAQRYRLRRGIDGGGTGEAKRG
ncbi:hypothetical protein GW17_00026296 [Ensete ventricosum]|nr:hypothetical protein GW17_00026296 [Ensete ventricosum]